MFKVHPFLEFVVDAGVEDVDGVIDVEVVEHKPGPDRQLSHFSCGSSNSVRRKHISELSGSS